MAIAWIAAVAISFSVLPHSRPAVMKMVAGSWEQKEEECRMQS